MADPDTGCGCGCDHSSCSGAAYHPGPDHSCEKTETGADEAAEDAADAADAETPRHGQTPAGKTAAAATAETTAAGELFKCRTYEGARS